MTPRYKVTLTVEERAELDALTRSGKTAARKHMKRRFVEEGLDSALERKPHTKFRQVTFDGAFEARLTALACSSAPKGRSRWTVRLLAERVVELKIAPSVSTMTIQRVLKKTNLSLTWANTGRSPRTGS